LFFTTIARWERFAFAHPALDYEGVDRRIDEEEYEISPNIETLFVTRDEIGTCWKTD